MPHRNPRTMSWWLEIGQCRGRVGGVCGDLPPRRKLAQHDIEDRQLVGVDRRIGLVGARKVRVHPGQPQPGLPRHHTVHQSRHFGRVDTDPMHAGIDLHMHVEALPSPGA
jgi:hypothetical protein